MRQFNDDIKIDIRDIDIGIRLDQCITNYLTGYSRACIQKWIENGFVSLNNIVCREKSLRINSNHNILILKNPTIESDVLWGADKGDLRIEYIDDYLIIINKEAGKVVHPGAGNYNNTLINNLIYSFPELSNLPRGGLVHRLDKGTSGLIIVSRCLESQNLLNIQIQNHIIEREYVCLVHGITSLNDYIEANISRDRNFRLRMKAIKNENIGKHSLTVFNRIKYFSNHSYLRVFPKTGRTHQIRVHLSFIGHPICGDKLYGGGPIILPNKEKLCLDRPMLHSRRLKFIHPVTNKKLEIEAVIPQDFNIGLSYLDKFKM